MGGLEKIRTIGDNYMIAAKVPVTRPDHAEAIAHLALDMIQELKAVPPRNGKRIEFRVGINSGPLVAGVIEESKFHYDLWGDTVNTASRNEARVWAGISRPATITYPLQCAILFLKNLPERWRNMTKNKSIWRIILLALVIVIASACDPSPDGPPLGTNANTDTNPAATSEQVAHTPEPAIETLMPTPTEESAQAPATPEPPIPTIMNRGAPANTRCVAMRSGSSPEALPVYQAADPESPVIAWLGNWADVQEFQPAWYGVLIPQGGQGWIAAETVELSVGCDAEQ